MADPGSLENLIGGWNGLAVISHRDSRTGTWIFIALHDNRRGVPTGGTRLRRYDRPADGLIDALRLAEGMTYKWAAVDLDAGGGKGVLCLSEQLSAAERPGLFERYGELVEGLCGAFGTGRDLGTTDADMLAIARKCRFVHGVDRETGTSRDPGPYTARGVLAAIEATVAHACDAPGLEGKRVLVQGVGAAGGPLSRLLAARGARLLLSDIDAERAASLAVELGGTAVAADETYDSDCDVYAPCAVGATLNEETIPRLRCRVVAGSANNQLGVPEDAARLHERGIVYAPDYLANGGGALAFGLMARGETDEQTLMRRVDGIGASMTEVLESAATRNESPAIAMQRVVRERLG
jgi:leucine dehydrogenase